jgi:hypothetical protein
MPKAEVDDEIIRIVERYGREYEPAVLPKDIQRGEPGMCFDWCMVQTALHKEKYQYVEGLALDPDKLRRGERKWILHAWMTDGTHAFDPTWLCEHAETGEELPIVTAYAGIPMEIHQAAGFVSMYGYQGLLANRKRNWPYVRRVLRAGV